jgi:hypothetical protein
MGYSALQQHEPPSKGSTLQVKRTNSRPRLVVTDDGEGIANHVGSALLTELTDQLGLTAAAAAAAAMASTRTRRCAHDRGMVLRDLVVMLADGGDCVSDLAALRDQPDLFGEVASTSTAWRVVDAVGPKQLVALAEARRVARAQAWEAGAVPAEVVLDFDATLVTSHSEKERAAGNFKRGFGFHPLLCHLDASGEALAGVLRPGSAGSNTAADHVDVLKAAVYQLPAIAFDKEILARADSGGATHEFVDALRELDIRFSVGFDLTAAVREAVLNTPETAWRPALTQDGDERDGAGVSELVGSNLSGWPPGSRVICRRERPHPGAQLTFTDHNGYRFQCFLTDQQGDDLAVLEARHRAHARVEDRIRCAKQTGLENLPFHDFAANQVWLELVLAAQDLIAWFQGLAEFGDDRTRYANAKCRKNYAGTAPITKASGKQKVVLARFVRNRHLADATYLWAFCTLTQSPGARHYYDTRRANGANHHQALRALGNRLVGLLHGCLRYRQNYSEVIAWGESALAA